MDKKAQQEMVGFVLIVVLVVVGLMVFLVISLRSSTAPEESSTEVSHMLSALLKKTTDCAPEFIPNYDSMRDLIKSCYGGQSCRSESYSACTHLNQSLGEDLSKMLATTPYKSYQFSITEETASGRQGMLLLTQGSCNGTYQGAQKSILQGANTLQIRLTIC